MGSILRSARERRGLTFKQIQEETKIHPRFLKALEEGGYSVFSSPVHIKGFLRIYARFLGLDENEVMAFFRREYDERQVGKPVGSIKPFRKPRFFWTPGWALSAVGAALVAIFFIYLLSGYLRYAGPPFLAVDQPPSDIVTSETFVEVAGQVGQGSEVSLNGEKLPVSEDGYFSLVVPLARGVNTLELVATSPLGRRTVVTRTVVVEVPEGSE